jgi:hypothetical protein
MIDLVALSAEAEQALYEHVPTLEIEERCRRCGAEWPCQARRLATGLSEAIEELRRVER